MLSGSMAKDADKPTKAQRELAVIRDTVESIWVAIVLAFVLRAFVFEAFVIPTGSMAPLLVGEHYDLVCPCCGLPYAYGLRSEQGGAPPTRGRPHMPVGRAACPNCGFPYTVTSEERFLNGGDRVLVLKYIYRFMEPRPWDVVVFRNPQNNQENYIKRLIGLPGETLEIIHGDIYVRDRGGPWRIRRKERKKVQETMWQVVFDNDYRPNLEMIEAYNARHPDAPIRPPGWDGPSWDLTGDSGRRFSFDGHAERAELAFTGKREAFMPRYGYNDERPVPSGVSVYAEEYVCGDLDLSLTYAPGSAGSDISLVLESLHHRFRTEVRADGTVTLFHSHPDVDDGREQVWQQTNIGPLEIGRGHKLEMANVDYRVSLWLDDRLIVRSTDAQYSPDLTADPLKTLRAAPEMERTLERTLHERRQRGLNTRELTERHDALLDRVRELVGVPAAKIIATGGPCKLTHVRLARDVFYTSQKLGLPTKGDPEVLLDYAHELGHQAGEEPGWGCTGRAIHLNKHADDPDLDEFFVLGDNSPQSLDGRAWVAAAPTLRLHDENGTPQYTLGTVPRYNLIGRALFVYWPSGYRIPGLTGLPIIPNVGKMRLIR